MREESGRSLIEIIGIMAIGAIMTVSAVSLYNMIRGNQMRAIAASTLEQVAADTRMLLGMRGDYSGVSVDYLIKAGALKSERAPLGGAMVCYRIGRREKILHKPDRTIGWRMRLFHYRNTKMGKRSTCKRNAGRFNRR